MLMKWIFILKYYFNYYIKILFYSFHSLDVQIPRQTWMYERSFHVYTASR